LRKAGYLNGKESDVGTPMEEEDRERAIVSAIKIKIRDATKPILKRSKGERARSSAVIKRSR